MPCNLRCIPWAALALLSLPSCLNLKEVRCNTRYADTAGYDDARKGEIQKPARTDGQICEEGYTYAQFQKDYEAGFSRGVTEVCIEEVARQAGHEDGTAGREDFPGMKTLSVCRGQPSYSSLKQVYQRGFQSAFCADGRVQSLAERDAEAFEARSPEIVFKACGASVGAVAETYHRRFDEALKRNCTPARAYALGSANARAGFDQIAGTRRLEVCPKEDQLTLLQSYRVGFDDTSRAAAEQRQVQLAEEAAQRREQERNKREQQHAVRMSLRTIKVKDQELFVQCLIEDGQAHVVVANPGKDSASLSPKWSIRFLNDAQVFLRSEATFQSLLIFGGQSEDFRVSAPPGARYCIAEVLGSP